MSPLYASAQDAAFQKFVAPFLNEHCFACHGPKKQESRLRLDEVTDVQAGNGNLRATEGTLLDHTVLLGGAQISSHPGKSFPTLLAGGRRLGFRHGQHIRYQQERKPMSDLYLTILQQLGCPVRSFKESSGPIAELLA